MPKKHNLISIAYGIMMALLTGVIYATPAADRIEHRYGLSFLYWLRGPITPPQGAVVVSIDKQSIAWLRQISMQPHDDHRQLIACLPTDIHDVLGRIRGPSSLPRSVHACLIDELHRLEFPVIALDVVFSVAGNTEDDAIFASAIRNHGGTTMLVGLDRSTLVVKGAEVLVEREVQPHVRFRQHAAATGAFLVTRSGGPAYGHLRGIPGLAVTGSFPNEAFRLMPKRLSNKSASADGRKSEFEYLWLYGAAGSISTVPMSQVLRGKMPENIRRSASSTAVFVGASDPNSNDYVDMYPSFFEGRFGANISGVELAATAFLNLWTGHKLHRLSPLAETMLVLMFAFALGLIARRAGGYGLLAVPLLAGVFLVVAALAFSEQRLFLPVATLAFVAAPVTFLTTIFVRYRLASSLIMRLAPAPVAQRMLATSTRHRGVVTQEEATVLFSDIIGSTTIGEQLTQMQFSRLMNCYYDTMTHEIETHRGFVAAFSGDGVTAVFSSSEAGPDHAKLACRAAISAVRSLRNVNQENAKVGYPPLDLRIGINSGLVAEGEIGARDRFNFSVIGDAVNLAARLEQMGKKLFADEKNLILIGAVTYCMVKDQGLSFRDCGMHPIPGRTAEEHVFRLDAACGLESPDSFD